MPDQWPAEMRSSGRIVGSLVSPTGRCLVSDPSVCWGDRAAQVTCSSHLSSHLEFNMSRSAKGLCPQSILVHTYVGLSFGTT